MGWIPKLYRKRSASVAVGNAGVSGSVAADYDFYDSGDGEQLELAILQGAGLADVHVGPGTYDFGAGGVVETIPVNSRVIGEGDDTIIVGRTSGVGNIFELSTVSAALENMRIHMPPPVGVVTASGVSLTADPILVSGYPAQLRDVSLFFDVSAAYDTFWNGVVGSIVSIDVSGFPETEQTIPVLIDGLRIGPAPQLTGSLVGVLIEDAAPTGFSRVQLRRVNIYGANVGIEANGLGALFLSEYLLVNQDDIGLSMVDVPFVAATQGRIRAIGASSSGSYIGVYSKDSSHIGISEIAVSCDVAGARKGLDFENAADSQIVGLSASGLSKGVHLQGTSSVVVDDYNIDAAIAIQVAAGATAVVGRGTYGAAVVTTVSYSNDTTTIARATSTSAVKTANYTAKRDQTILYDPSGGTFTLTAVSAPAPVRGDTFAVKNTTNDVTAITVSGGGPNIEDPQTGTLVASFTVGLAFFSARWLYDGTRWGIESAV